MKGEHNVISIHFVDFKDGHGSGPYRVAVSGVTPDGGTCHIIHEVHGILVMYQYGKLCTQNGVIIGG
jgi:hypothetical protein